MGQIYLVRHGQASFGAADYDQLSEVGTEQSRLLGRWFAGCGLRLGGVVTGSLRRHRQTAEACTSVLPAAFRPPAAWSTDPGFDEYDHHQVLARYRPEFSSLAATHEILARAGNPRRAFQQIFFEAMQRWMSGRHDAEYRESWSGFRARTAAALQRLIEQTGPSQTAVVFTSGGPIAAICQELLNVPEAKALELNTVMVNSAVTRLLYRSDRPDGPDRRISLSYFNNFAHLEQTRQPDIITYR
ncbi:MAG: histidine phosphatase family protein [Nevskiales bacterium]|nr:histidine phosphatase family protein [Nevskiales bacterium]